MREKFKFVDLEDAGFTIGAVIDVIKEFHEAKDRSGLKGMVPYLADATAAFVHLLRRPHVISLGASSNRELWKDMSPLRRNEIKLARLMKTARSPRCSKACLNRITDEVADLALDVRLIIAIRRRMLARSR